MLVRDSFERHADFRMLDCSHLEETCVRVEDGTESSSWLHSLLVSRGIARQVRHALGGDLSRVTLPRATRPTSSPYYNKASDPNYYLLVAHSYEPLRTVCSTAEAAWYTPRYALHIRVCAGANVAARHYYSTIVYTYIFTLLE